MNRKEIGNGRRNNRGAAAAPRAPRTNSFTEFKFDQERLAIRRLSALRQKQPFPQSQLLGRSRPEKADREIVISKASTRIRPSTQIKLDAFFIHRTIVRPSTTKRRWD